MQSTKPFTKEDLIEKVTTLRNHMGGQFSKFRNDHIRYLNGDAAAAVLLSYLINKFNMLSSLHGGLKKLFRTKMWFECPSKEIEEELCIKTDKRRAALAKLARKKIIKSERKAGNRLWIKINVRRLERIERDDLKNQEKNLLNNMDLPQNNGFSTEPTSYKNTIETKDTRPLSRDVTDQGSFFPPSEEDVSYGSLCKYAYDTLLKRKKILRPLPNGKKTKRPITSTWSKEFMSLENQLIASRCISRDQARHHIHVIIKDYVLHAGNAYQPAKYSAKTMREDFVKIEESVERRKNTVVDESGNSRLKQEDGRKYW